MVSKKAKKVKQPIDKAKLAEEKDNEAKNEIIKQYVGFVKKNTRHPTRADLIKMGISRDRVRHHFGNMENLRKAAKEFKPEIFKGVIDERLFTRKVLAELKDRIAKKRRYIITTAVAACKPHMGFMKNLELYCENNNAELLIIPTADPAHNLDRDPNLQLSSYFADKNIVFDDVRLNDNLFISSIKINAKQVQPLTGLKRIGQKNGSFIFGSPKQMLESVATSNFKYPRILVTPGCCTVSDYVTNSFTSQRTAYIADNDHVLGALVVEIESNRIFHMRQIQAESGTGNFVDLSKYYQDGKTVGVLTPSEFVIGDWHYGSTDPTARRAWLEISKYTGCFNWIMHDVFDGDPVNHHEMKKTITRAKLANERRLNLKDYIVGLSEDFNQLFREGIRKITIVKSNHDEFLDRWLEDGKYTKDAQNLLIALDLAKAQLLGEDPLKWGIENIGNLHKNHTGKITWLDRDEDHKVANIETGAHGDLGANGSKGSPQSLENAYGNGTFAHRHSPLIVRGIWFAGTSTFLKLRYNRGPSGWAQSSVLHYPNGSRQMIFSIKGKWRVPPKKK